MNINFTPSPESAPSTDLCEIMSRHGSDKGSPTNNCSHNYTKYYHELFSPVKLANLRIFELGLGTNNINVPSNMGIHGKLPIRVVSVLPEFHYFWRRHRPRNLASISGIAY